LSRYNSTSAVGVVGNLVVEEAVLVGLGSHRRGRRSRIQKEGAKGRLEGGGWDVMVPLCRLAGQGEKREGVKKQAVGFTIAGDGMMEAGYSNLVQLQLQVSFPEPSLMPSLIRSQHPPSSSSSLLHSIPVRTLSAGCEQVPGASRALS